MKLLMIQGNHIARYIGRTQEVVLHLEAWEDWPTVKDDLETLRRDGKEALGL